MPPKSDFWEWFTNAEDPQDSLSAVCKYCKQSVNYHRKSEQAKRHLNACPKFQYFMSGSRERPEWYQPKKRKVEVRESHPKTTQTTLNLVNNLSPEDQAKFEQKLALFFYLTGTPFSHCEHFMLKETLQVLRPDVKLPSRHKMSSILLEAEYTRQMTEMKETLQNHMVCMTSDGWTNVNSSPILNYLVSFQGKSFFLEAVSTKTNRHSADFLFGEIGKRIDRYRDTFDVV